MDGVARGGQHAGVHRRPRPRRHALRRGRPPRRHRGRGRREPLGGHHGRAAARGAQEGSSRQQGARGGRGRGTRGCGRRRGFRSHPQQRRQAALRRQRSRRGRRLRGAVVEGGHPRDGGRGGVLPARALPLAGGGHHLRGERALPRGAGVVGRLLRHPRAGALRHRRGPAGEHDDGQRVPVIRGVHRWLPQRREAGGHCDDQRAGPHARGHGPRGGWQRGNARGDGRGDGVLRGRRPAFLPDRANTVAQGARARTRTCVRTQARLRSLPREIAADGQLARVPRPPPRARPPLPRVHSASRPTAAAP